LRGSSALATAGETVGLRHAASTTAIQSVRTAPSAATAKLAPCPPNEKGKTAASAVHRSRSKAMSCD
jgi:hypothetical protein